MYSSSALLHELQRVSLNPCAMGIAGRSGGGHQHVCEHSYPDPRSGDSLDESRELDFATAENLPLVARTLAQLGGVVIVEYDADRQRLVFRAGRSESGTRQPTPIEQHASSSRSIAFDYDVEGSERRSLGSVDVDAGAWWSAELTVPNGDAGQQGGTLFLRLERHGVPLDGYLGATDVELSLPEAEVDQIAGLLIRLVDQAHQDGVVLSRPRVRERIWRRYTLSGCTGDARRLRLV